MRSAGIGYVLVSLLSACSSRALLAVDLRTDLVPEIEMTTVRTRLLVDGREVATDSARVEAGDTYATGARVAELTDLPAGAVATLETEVLGPDGSEVARQLTVVSLRSAANAVTVLITRDCAGVTCDDPGVGACLGARCVDPECSAEDAVCLAEAECTADADCAAPGACASAACVSGSCFAFPGECAADEYCDPDSGCRARPGAEPLCTVADPDVVALWDFDEGGLVDRVSGAAMIPSPSAADFVFDVGAERCGEGIRFPDAGDPRLRIPADPRYALAEGSLDFWFRFPADEGADKALITRDHEGASPPGQLSVQLTLDRALFVRIQNEAGGHVRCSAVGVASDVWHHVGVNWGPGGFEAWLDGAVVDEAGEARVLDPDAGERLIPCGSGVNEAGLDGAGAELDWWVGINNGYSPAGTADRQIAPFLGGALDHLRLSRVRRDFSVFR